MTQPGGTSSVGPVLTDLARVLAAVGPALAPVGSARLLDSIPATARELFGAAACSLALLTDDESELVFTTASGAGAQDVIGRRIPSSQGIAGWVVTSEQPLEVRELQRDARFARGFAESTGYVPTAILAVPVTSPRRLLGVLSLLDRDTERPDAAHDLRLLQLFADQAALAIEGQRVFADLGTAVLGAVAAADPGAELADALAAAAAEPGRPDPALLEIASLLADLDAAGPAERTLAVSLLSDVLAYARGRSRRPV